MTRNAWQNKRYFRYPGCILVYIHPLSQACSFTGSDWFTKPLRAKIELAIIKFRFITSISNFHSVCTKLCSVCIICQENIEVTLNAWSQSNRNQDFLFLVFLVKPSSVIAEWNRVGSKYEIAMTTTTLRRTVTLVTLQVHSDSYANCSRALSVFFFSNNV